MLDPPQPLRAFDDRAALDLQGGTSLSKGWKLIQRFSEDIDVVIDRRFLGFGGDHSPEEAPSHKQRGRRLDELKGACQHHIRHVLRPDLDELIRSALAVRDDWRLEIDPDDEDEQTLLFHYPTVTIDTGYVRPAVKIELGARSDTDPSESPSISPYLADVFPGEFDRGGCSVRTVAPERTFWEKVALLHEESYRSEGRRHGSPGTTTISGVCCWPALAPARTRIRRSSSGSPPTARCSFARAGPCRSRFGAADCAWCHRQIADWPGSATTMPCET